MQSEDRVAVVLGLPVERRHIQQIQAISSRLMVRAAGDLLAEEEQQAASGEGQRVPGVQQRVNDLLEDADVMFTEIVPEHLHQRAPRLQWVQLNFAGPDHAMRPDIVEIPIAVTVARGVLGRTIAEHILGCMLFFSRRFDRAVALQRERRWDPQATVPWELRGKRVGIVGYGDIGHEAARLVRSLDMEVIVVRRSARSPISNVEGLDLLLPPSHLHSLLETADFVVVAVPLTPETEGMIGEAELRRMRPSAFFINVGRGKVADEDALIRALQEERIAGAALDVFREEPPPAESPLWTMPNVLITPHIAGPSEGYLDACVDLFCANLRRFLQGEPLLHQVDKTRWY